MKGYDTSNGYMGYVEVLEDAELDPDEFDF